MKMITRERAPSIIVIILFLTSVDSIETGGDSAQPQNRDQRLPADET